VIGNLIRGSTPIHRGRADFRFVDGAGAAARTLAGIFGALTGTYYRL